MKRALLAIALATLSAACGGNNSKDSDKSADSTSKSEKSEAAIEATVPPTNSTLPSTIHARSWEHTFPNKTSAEIVIQRVYTDNEGSGIEADRAKDAPAEGMTRVMVVAEMDSPNALPTLDTAPLAVVNAKTQKVYRDNPDPDALEKAWGFCNGASLDGPWNCVSADYFSGKAYVRGAIDVPVGEVNDLRVGWLVAPNGTCEPGVAQSIQYIPEGATTPIEGCLHEVPLAH